MIVASVFLFITQKKNGVTIKAHYFHRWMRMLFTFSIFLHTKIHPSYKITRHHTWVHSHSNIFLHRPTAAEITSVNMSETNKLSEC